MGAPDYDAILPELYMGGHFLPPPERALDSFDLRVLCAKELQNDDSHQAVRVASVPLDDDGSPLSGTDALLVRDAALIVARRVREGKRVLVTCAAGRNRSGLVCARALMFLGYPPRNAINCVRARRRWTQGSPALANEAFCSWLMGGG